MAGTSPRVPLALCALVVVWVSPAPARAQHDEPGAVRPIELRGGAHAIVLVTHVSPILAGAAKTEAYLTQPLLTAELTMFGHALHALASISLEPLTLERGELGAGSYGEGYVDRRHPHTYAHELVLSATGQVGAVAGSLALGRGFVPFGSDDPMMRPFVKFPVNHHLAQILERLVALVGVRAGPLLLEAALFAGAEPFATTDWGSIDRFGDSWAARLTVVPADGFELQASFAAVASPEMPRGAGQDQRKWSASLRSERPLGNGTVYALAEWKRTTVIDEGRTLFALGSVLAEAELTHDGWRPALRFERTYRPEEERSFDPFRAPWPHADALVLGMTRWTVVGARLQRDVVAGALRVAPFFEASYARVSETAGGPFDPTVFYGGRNLWTFNVGVRAQVGSHRSRMGRYGVAAADSAGGHTH